MLFSLLANFSAGNFAKFEYPYPQIAHKYLNIIYIRDNQILHFFARQDEKWLICDYYIKILYLYDYTHILYIENLPPPPLLREFGITLSTAPANKIKNRQFKSSVHFFQNLRLPQKAHRMYEFLRMRQKFHEMRQKFHRMRKLSQRMKYFLRHFLPQSKVSKCAQYKRKITKTISARET